MIRYLFFGLFLIGTIAGDSQVLPSEILSTNSCSSLIQDRLNNIVPQEATLKGYFFNAPSYVRVDSSSINFYSILTGKAIDYTKLNPLALSGELKDLVKQVVASGAIKTFIIVRGSARIVANRITLALEDVAGSDDADPAIGPLLLQKYKQLKLYELDNIHLQYDRYSYDKVRINAAFLASGLALWVDNGPAIGTLSIDAKRQRKLGDAWSRFAQRTSNVPFAAIASGRNSFLAREYFDWRFLVALALFLAVLFLHARVIGVSPFPGGWTPPF